MSSFIRKSSCFTVFILLLVPACLSALDLFSYEDDYGRKYVVDSIEKVPVRFRNNVKKNKIGQFKPANKEILGSEKDNFVLESPKVKPEKDKFIIPILAEAPPEIDLEKERAKLASVTIIIEGMIKIQENNEQMHLFSRTNQLRHPIILTLQNENFKILKDLKNFKSSDWEEAKDFMSNYSELSEKFWKIQWTVSKWIKEGGEGIKTGFLPLLQGSRRSLDKLRIIYNELKNKISSEMEVK